MGSKSKRGAFLESMAHYLTAFVILLKGLDKVEIDGKAGYGIIFIVISILIVAGTIFHHRAEKYFKHFKPVVFVLEAVVMAIVGYLYLKDGKQFIQYMCFFASFMCVIATIIYFSKMKRIASTSSSE
jgi:hypothetical protein